MEIKFLIDMIKDLPKELKIFGIMVVVVGIVIIHLFHRKAKNSNNFKKAEIDENTEIEIGDESSNEENLEMKNSNNFKEAKIGKNSKIKIGDKN